MNQTVTQVSQFCEFLGLKAPIIQAPMAGGVLSPAFIADVSTMGLLGSLATGYLSHSQIEQAIKLIKATTQAPFAINLFVDYQCYADVPLMKPHEILALEQLLLPAVKPQFQLPATPTMDDLIGLLIAQHATMVSTVFGLLRPDHITALHAHNVKIMTTVNSVYEADLALKTQQPDVLIVQNSLAGGHKGGFTTLNYDEATEVLRHVRQTAPHVFVVLAGNIVTKSDVTTALDQGFDGVQIGTGFLCCAESLVSPVAKAALVERDDTITTCAVTGKQARGLNNRLTSLELRENLGFPYQHYATQELRQAAKAANNLDYQAIWCGSSIAKIKFIPPLKDYIAALLR